MRSLLRLLPFIFIYIVTSCKKNDEPLPTNFGYLTSACQLAAWGDFNGRTCFSKYDSDNRLSEIYTYLYNWPSPQSYYTLFRTLEYENGELKRIVVPKVDSTEPHHRKREAWAILEYEYGQFGLISVRQFGYEGYRNGEIARVETARHEFSYNSKGKPSEIRTYVYVNRDHDDLRLRVRRKFEFDEKGNASKETGESIDVRDETRGEVMYTFSNRYFYDDYPNTVKVKRFLDFNYLTVPEVFSTNNLIRAESGSESIDFHMKYDDFNNDGRAAQWDCK